MLLSILQDIAAEEGLDLSDPEQKSLAISRVNIAARELYNSTDLEGAVEERIFDIMVAENQITLPWNVGEVRAIRWYGSSALPLEDMLNRYHADEVSSEFYGADRFRDKGYSPLEKSIENNSTLSFSLPKVDTVAFSVAISGTTPNSAKITEILSFAPGDLEKETTNNFIEPLITIIKSVPTTYNMFVYDANGNELATIPNFILESKFRVFQVYEDDPVNNVNSTQQGVEVLYKRTFYPMWNDYDSFVCGDVYDKAIFYMYMAHRAKTTEDKAVHLQAAVGIVNKITANFTAGKSKKLRFATGPYFGPPYNPINRFDRIYE